MPLKKEQLNAFVIMPFSDPFNSYYTAIYKPALESVGFCVHRADDLFAPRPIIDDIRKYIISADLLLCEMSGRNPNVFYELGLAHAIGKPVILISNNDCDIPFDFQHIRVIIYKSIDHDWAEKLINKIKRSANEIKNSESAEYLKPLLISNFDFNHIHKDKVRSLNWDKLSDAEQKSYYEKFKDLMPKLYKPKHSVISKEDQLKLNEINPIDLSPLLDTLKSYSISCDNVCLPIDAASYDLIHDRDIDIAGSIAEKIDGGINDSQLKSANKLYDYLSCVENKIDIDNEFVDAVDLIVVPGCRKGMQYRLDEAYKIAARSRAGIYISGRHSYYEEEHGPSISEANAMQYYLTKVKHLDTNLVNLYVDDRARDTRESVINSLGIFQEIRSKIGRKLNIILVTSPYHMRRLYFLYNRWLSIETNLVDQVRCINSSTFFDKRFWHSSHTSNNNPFGHNYGISVYIREYFKIIGGRATGEF